MIYLGILLGIGIMAATIYMVFDKKSTPVIRIACLIALGVMVLTTIICLIMIFTGNQKVVVDESILIVGAPIETVDTGNSGTIVLMILVIILIGLFSLIAHHAIKENKKSNPKKSDKKNYSSNFDF